MKRVVYSKEITLNRSADDLRLSLNEEFEKNRRSHLSENTGLTAEITGKRIRFNYRYKKLQEEDISFVPGKLPDLTVHHKYAVAQISPVSDTSAKLHIDFVDDSELCIKLSWFVFFPLFVFFSAFLSFSAVGDSISHTAAGIISVFFAALWLFIAFVITKNIKNESDETFPLLENEIYALLDSLN